ncbi:MAG: DHA2 family efflux MFS transporter permease subunit [Candidatus Binataceae bacterium]
MKSAYQAPSRPPRSVASSTVAGWTGGHNRWAIALTVTIATFMEVLDTSVANIALPSIAGSLAASQTQSTWVLTAYLVSNAIVLPTSAWMALRLGRKRFYMGCVALFTFSSVLCGLAPSLAMLIICRILQGAGGGGLGPSEQGILADTFAPSEHGIAFAIYGMAVILAPAIGPALGGWIIDRYDWRWIFFINVPAGILSLLLTRDLVADPPYLVRQRQKTRRVSVDWTGLVLVATFLGSLQIMLDRGGQANWFQSANIQMLGVTCALGFAAFLIWEFSHANPIVDLQLFRNRNYGIAGLLMFVLGFALYGSVVLLPQMMQNLMGYSAELAGLVLSPGGFAMVAVMPLAGGLAMVCDSRRLLALGFAVSAAALYHMTALDLGASFRSLVMLRIYQAGALAFLFVPINTLAYAGIPGDHNDDVSSMINLARNIGGSVGIALTSTLVSRRTQFHQHNLVAYVTSYDSNVRALNHHLGHLLSRGGLGVAGSHQAVVQLYGALRAEAAMMAYNDAFFMMAMLCAAMVPIALLMKKNKSGRGIVIG